MRDAMPYHLLANVVLILHFSIVAFVVGGLVLTIIGNLSAWRWVNALWFRLAHLVAIAVVVAQAWFGATCPLTSVEMWLRANAAATTYSGGFIEHWLQRLLYYEAPAWVFTLGYSLFGLLVAVTWWCFPPTTNRSGKEPERSGISATAAFGQDAASTPDVKHELSAAVSDSSVPQMNAKTRQDA